MIAIIHDLLPDRLVTQVTIASQQLNLSPAVVPVCVDDDGAVVGVGKIVGGTNDDDGDDQLLFDDAFRVIDVEIRRTRDHRRRNRSMSSSFDIVVVRRLHLVEGVGKHVPTPAR